MSYDVQGLGQDRRQELHRDLVAQVYLGEASDEETQRRTRSRIDWIVEQCEGPVIFDVGCSEGITAILLGQRGLRTDAIDINPEIVDYARALATKWASRPGFVMPEFTVCDLFALSEIRPDYDTVVLGEVLAQVHEPGHMLQRAAFALKAGGRLIVTMPWGHAPAPGRQQTFYLTSLLALVPPEMRVESLDVRDGYIRLLLRKEYDPRDIRGERRNLPANLPNASQLLQMSEAAALASQTSLCSAHELKDVELERLETEKQELQEAQRKAEEKYQQLVGRLSTATRLALEIYRIPFVRTVALAVLPQSLRKRLEQSARAALPAVVRQPVEPNKKILTPAALGVFRRDLDAVVICNAYPGTRQLYGGEFIRSRLDAYAARGIKVCVVELHNRNRATEVENVGGIPVLRSMLAAEAEVLSELRSIQCPVLLHSPSPEWQMSLPLAVAPTRIVYWFHGFEVIDYRKFHFNYTTDELEFRRAELDNINMQRMEAARQTFADERIAKVFVSNYLARMATSHVGMVPRNAHVIHNFIDCDFYRVEERDDENFSSVLLLRPFTGPKYAADIAVGALLLLARRPEFARLRVTIAGWGPHFRDSTRPLRKFKNVRLVERYSTPEQMRELYASHGVSLCPTRHDTQGVSFCEAMAAGMVCVTNRVSAIPEFADDTTALLVPGDNIPAYAEAIMRAVSDPNASRIMGQKAAARMREQCGAQATLAREISLIVRE